MKKQIHIPFSALTFEEWQNLAMVAVAIFYLVLVGRIITINRPICEITAGDYCAYWSAGKVANSFGYSKIYDLNLLAQIQKANSSQISTDNSTFEVLPFAYLPIFVLPFQLISLLDVTTGFWVWTFVNLIAFVYYLRFFYKSVMGSILPFRLAILFVLSLQVFINLYAGQVNLWLAIFVGEFIRLALSGKSFLAGVWLGCLLLKPQLLIVIIPVIFIKRWKSMIAGFCLSSFFILLISFLLAQIDGLYSFFSLLFGYSKGVTTSSIEIMMNWRMLGFNLSSLINPIVGWSIVLIGSLITIIAIVYIWIKSDNTNPQVFVICALATFAATGALTWHAHLSMSLVLIPPMVYLYANKQLSNREISWWVFAPTIIWFIRYMIGASIALQMLPLTIIWYLNFLFGLTGLALNLYFTFWALEKIRRISFNKQESPQISIDKMMIS